MLVLDLYSRASQTHYVGLDKRWELVSTVTHLARYLSTFQKKCETVPTFDMRAPLRPINHPFGLHEIIAEIPDDTTEIEVHSIVLHENLYVCGLGFSHGLARLFVGNQSKTVNKVGVSHTDFDVVGFIVDALGIRTLRFGDSPWFCGGPESLKCWEGITRRRGATKIRIVLDVSILAYAWMISDK